MTKTFTSLSMAIAALALLGLQAGCAHRAGGQAMGAMMGPGAMSSGTSGQHEMGKMPMHDQCSREMQEKHQRMAEQHAKERGLPAPEAHARAACPMKAP